jgi:hypothetical protein
VWRCVSLNNWTRTYRIIPKWTLMWWTGEILLETAPEDKILIIVWDLWTFVRRGLKIRIILSAELKVQSDFMCFIDTKVLNKTCRTWVKTTLSYRVCKVQTPLQQFLPNHRVYVRDKRRCYGISFQLSTLIAVSVVRSFIKGMETSKCYGFHVFGSAEIFVVRNDGFHFTKIRFLTQRYSC